MPRGPQSAFADLTLGAAFASLAIAAGVGFGLARPLGVWRALLTAMIAVSGTGPGGRAHDALPTPPRAAPVCWSSPRCVAAPSWAAARLRQASRAAA